MKSSFFKELKRRNVYKVATVYAITAWLLIQISDTVFPRLNFPDWTVSFVIVCVAIGFPIALILAWAFEMTSEGIKRTLPEEVDQNTTSSNSLNYWIIGLLITALLFLGVERIFFAESTLIADNTNDSNKTTSIAVLPFSDFSPKGDQEYFADGISEELLNVLAKVEGLQVAGRTSAFQFKGENPDLKEVGRKLGVNYILEGSVRKSGDQLRITAQLIKAENGFHEWSETYDRPYTTQNVFEIQDEISRKVLKELKVKLGAGQKGVLNQKNITENKKAYELYLKGMNKVASYLPEDIEKAIQFYNAAIDLDPSFGMAYARKAFAFHLLEDKGNIPEDAALDSMSHALNWIRVYDFESAESLLSLTYMLGRQGNFEQALLAIKRAKDLQPGNGEIRLLLSKVLRAIGKNKEADEEMINALELEPLSANINLEVGKLYFRKNENLDKAEELLQKAIEIQPDMLDAYLELADYYNFVENRIDEGFILMHRAYDRVQKKSKALDRIFFPAVDLNIDPYAKQWVTYFENNFPNYKRRFFIETYFLEKQKKYTEVMPNTHKLENEIEKLPTRPYLSNISLALMMAGNANQFIKIVKERDPSLLEVGGFRSISPLLSLHLAIAAALHRTGELQKANKKLNEIVSYIESTDPDKAYLDWLGKNSRIYIAAKALLGDKTLAKRYLQERKEKEHIVNHWIIYDMHNKLYYNLPEEMIKPYREAELKIIREQRQNVIEYLREQEEWNEDWNEEITNNS